MEVDTTTASAPAADATGKKVSFAPDAKPDIASLSSRTPSVVPSEEAKEAAPIDGVIGQLEVYKSGAVKIRLANGILLDVRLPALQTIVTLIIHSSFRNNLGQRSYPTLLPAASYYA
jgi:DNA-directed RNA polymerase III subunit RPC4